MSIYRKAVKWNYDARLSPYMPQPLNTVTKSHIPALNGSQFAINRFTPVCYVPAIQKGLSTSGRWS